MYFPLRFVRLDYFPVSSLDHAVHVFSEQTFKSDNNEFVEGLMYGKDRGVIMVGNMVDDAGSGQVRWNHKLGLGFSVRFSLSRSSGLHRVYDLLPIWQF